MEYLVGLTLEAFIILFFVSVMLGVVAGTFLAWGFVLRGPLRKFLWKEDANGIKSSVETSK